MENTIRITETELKNIINEVINKIDWDRVRQNRMDNFWDTLEYYLHIKDERGFLSNEQMVDAREVADKLSCFGEDAYEYCEYVKKELGLDETLNNLDEIIRKSIKKYLK